MGRGYIKIILKNHARSYFAGRSYYRGNTVVNIASENSTNLWKYSFSILKYWIGVKFRAHKRLFWSFGRNCLKKIWALAD